jgi:hypothetical protein
MHYVLGGKVDCFATLAMTKEKDVIARERSDRGNLLRMHNQWIEQAKLFILALCRKLFLVDAQLTIYTFDFIISITAVQLQSRVESDRVIFSRSSDCGNNQFAIKIITRLYRIEMT